MAERVDAVEESMQSPCLDGAMNCSLAHAKATELATRNRSMLLRRQDRQSSAQIGVPFARYADIRRTAVGFAPSL
jgi:hypothetical protein